MTSELENGSWTVISERGCEENGLTHEQARRLVHRMGGEGFHGLCIITDEAASRMFANSPIDSETTAETTV